MVAAFSLLALSIACYSVRELQAHGKLRWQEDEDGFWNNNSWTRKYATDDKGFFIPAPKNIYYRFFKIKYKERFPLSATFLVSITDSYHLLQSLSFLSMSGCVSLLSGIPFYFVWPGIIFVHALIYKLLSK